MIDDATSNFGFKNLEGSDEAGYNTINELITDIDNELYERVAVPGMVMLWNTAGGSAPEGWSNVGTPPANPGFGLPDVSATGTYIWIQKDA